MAEPIALKYRAFLSYSHADVKWAKRLHNRLEGFRIDKDLVGRKTALGQIPKSLRPVFRDREDFTAGHTLTDQTLAALDASIALIILCSPASAKSHFVNEEVRLFKSRHPERPVIPVIVDGTPGDLERECFAPAIKFLVGVDGVITSTPAEVLAADVREAGDGFDMAAAKVVAGLIGLSTDDVYRRAEHVGVPLPSFQQSDPACDMLGTGAHHATHIERTIFTNLALRRAVGGQQAQQGGKST